MLSCIAASKVRVIFGCTAGRTLGWVSSVRRLCAAACITPMVGGATGVLLLAASAPPCVHSGQLGARGQL